MATRITPLQIGDHEVLVEAIVQAGTEKTSTLDEAGKKVVNAYSRAEAVIEDIALSTTATLSRLARHATRPTVLEVEFGLGFTVKGNVVVVGGEANAALKIKLIFDSAENAQRRSSNSPEDPLADSGSTG